VKNSASPAGRLLAGGETVIASNAAGRTVTTDKPLTVEEGAVAVMSATPVPVAVTCPCDPVTFETVATVEAEVPQVAVFVKLCVLPSE
jgi:hypothetical protein